MHSGRVEGVKIFPTTVDRVRECLAPLRFKLARRRGILGPASLSPLVLLEFERTGAPG